MIFLRWLGVAMLVLFGVLLLYSGLQSGSEAREAVTYTATNRFNMIAWGLILLGAAAAQAQAFWESL